VEKNNTKLENLLLIGYSPTRVARPYQMLTVGLNILVLILALVILFFLRGIYLDMFKGMFPRMEIPSMMPAVLVGLGLLLLVSILNIVAVRTKIMSIWKRKN
jgi:membrane protease YdiL (CAAX protease family)